MEGRDLVCAIKGHYICEDWDQCKLTMEQQMKQQQSMPASAPRALEKRRGNALLVAVWAAIAIPLAWGVGITLTKSLALFR